MVPFSEEKVIIFDEDWQFSCCSTFHVGVSKATEAALTKIPPHPWQVAKYSLSTKERN